MEKTIMIRCRKCGITYKDDATLCLRCMNPLPRPTGKESERKPVRKEALERVYAERKRSSVLIATATPPPHHQKIVATATSPPPRKSQSESHNDGPSPISAPLEENSNTSITETPVPQEPVKNEETLNISTTTMGLLEQLKKLNESSEPSAEVDKVSEEEMTSDPSVTQSITPTGSNSETSTSSQVKPSLEEPTKVPTEDEKFKKELNQLKDEIAKLEPNTTIEKINPQFGEIRVDELQKYFTIIDSLENAEALYAQSKEKLSFNRGYMLESGYITQLNISDFGLSAVLPDKLSSLQRLSALDLERNNFETFPDGLERISKLENLNISECGMKDLSGSVGKLTNLTSLWLYENEITKIPTNLGSLENLELLDLRGNKLGENNLAPIFELKKLKFLSLASNNLRLISNKLDELTELETLLIGDNPLEDFPDISNLKNLKQLSLYDTKLKYVPESLLFLPNLRTLDIWNTPIKSNDWIIMELKEAGVVIKMDSN